MLGRISSFSDQRQLESASNDPVQRRNSSTQCLRQRACNALRVAPQKHVPTRACFLPTIRGGWRAYPVERCTEGYKIFIGATLKQGHGEKHQPTRSCRTPPSAMSRMSSPACLLGSEPLKRTLCRPQSFKLSLSLSRSCLANFQPCTHSVYV